MTPIADLLGPLAEGVILFGILPAVALVTLMVAISRLVDWKTDQTLASATLDSEHQLPE